MVGLKQKCLWAFDLEVRIEKKIAYNNVPSNNMRGCRPDLARCSMAEIYPKKQKHVKNSSQYIPLIQKFHFHKNKIFDIRNYIASDY